MKLVHSIFFSVLASRGHASEIQEVSRHDRRLASTSCPRTLAALEVHMDQAFSLYQVTINRPFNCICNEDESSGMEVTAALLDIECTLEYDESFTVERMSLEASGDGTYQLMSATWADPMYDSYDDPQEIYAFQDGILSSCEGTGCEYCSICEDGQSISLDCTALGDSGFVTDCDYVYTGAFANTFDFSNLVPPSPITVDEFCMDLSALETQISRGFANLFFYLPTFVPEDNLAVCACSDNTSLLTIDCTLEYNIDGFTGTTIEQLVLEAVGGEFTLTRSSYADSLLPAFPDPQESYYFENGELATCEVAGCNSCVTCPDSKFVAIDCNNLGDDRDYEIICEDGYVGSFVRSFNFARILTNQTSDGDSESITPSTSPVAVASASPSAAPVAAKSEAPTTAPIAEESKAPSTSPVEVTVGSVAPATPAVVDESAAPSASPKGAETERPTEISGGFSVRISKVLIGSMMLLLAFSHQNTG